jgi:peptidoglycan/xylan/chitin deacetylase (PgdA/CDA1 family)
VDVEQDCPPYLDTWRGVEEGLPWLLDALARAHAPATFFVTGEVARRFPDAVRRIVADGHELGCHGDTHRRYSTLSLEEAGRDLERACAVLRTFAPVTSFRAPNLDLPSAFLPIVESRGFTVDASGARYKFRFARPRRVNHVVCLPASVTSSVLRLPDIIRRPILERLDDPAVIFVHPWEFVDLRHAAIRWDCRFRTGARARRAFESSVAMFDEAGAGFSRVRDCRVD